jgi:uncharacterized membrane protein
VNNIIYSVLIVGLFLSGVATLSMVLFSEYQEHGSCGSICLRSPYLWLPVLTAGGCVVGALAILVAVKDKQREFEKQTVAAVLTEDESFVVAELEKNNGELTQQELGWRTNLSKVKIHRILSRLEKRKIIEKINYGKTRLIRIVLK